MMGLTRIIAVRHGQTDWNVARRIQGHTDIALNAHGLWQAKRVGQALAGEPIACIYSSDLGRARATAQAIAMHCVATPHAAIPHSAAHIPAPNAPAPPAIHIHSGLRERGFGVFEGHTYPDIEARWPKEAQRWRQRDPDFAPTGGESPLQVQQRVTHTLGAIARQHLGQQIVLVTHGGIVDMLYRIATQQSVSAPRTWETGNATINRLLWSADALTLVGWADAQHLEVPETVQEMVQATVQETEQEAVPEQP